MPAISVISLILFPVTSMSKYPRSVNRIAGFGLLGAAGFVISGLVNSVPIDSGSLVAFLVTSAVIVGVGKSAKDVESAAQVFAWLGIGTALFFWVVGYQGDRDPALLWKYGVAYPLTGTILYVALRKRRANIAVGLLAAVGVLSFFWNFRSFAIICFVAVLFVIARGGRTVRLAKRIARVALAAALLAALSVAIPAAIAGGVFGDDIRSKTLAQSEGSSSFLLAGRTEPPLSIAAIAARPITGWGNLQSIDPTTVQAATELAASLGLQDPAFYLGSWFREDGRVSVHSVLLGSWATGGVLAALLPLAAIGVFARALFVARGSYYPLIAIVALGGIWDLVFSPWSTNRAAVLGISLIIATWAIAERKTNRHNEHRTTPMHVTRKSQHGNMSPIQ